MSTVDVKLISAILLFGFFVLSCSTSEEDPADPTKNITLPSFSFITTSDVFVYQCDDSLQFTAHVTQDSTWLFLPDTTLKVLPVEAGSGAKYEGSSYLYWSKDNEAILQQPKGSFITCQTVPEEKAWQAAKIRGVDFRALGQEPGWHLEITGDKKIRYVSSYGRDTVFTPAPDPEVTDEQRTVYRAETEAHVVTVEIVNEPCTDSMSGFKFPATVTVTVDGETYNGCGRHLD